MLKLCAGMVKDYTSNHIFYEYCDLNTLGLIGGGYAQIPFIVKSFGHVFIMHFNVSFMFKNFVF